VPGNRLGNSFNMQIIAKDQYSVGEAEPQRQGKEGEQWKITPPADSL